MPFHAYELVDRVGGSGAQGFLGTWRLHVINAPLFGTAWRVVFLQMEKVWMAAASILNSQSRTADSGWASSLGVEQRANCSL